MEGLKRRPAWADKGVNMLTGVQAFLHHHLALLCGWCTQASTWTQAKQGQPTSWNMRSTSTSLPGALARGAGALAAASAATKRSTSGRCCPRTLLGCVGNVCSADWPGTAHARPYMGKGCAGVIWNIMEDRHISINEWQEVVPQDVRGDTLG